MSELLTGAWLDSLTTDPYLRLGAIVAGAVVLALLARLVLVPLLRRLARRTSSDIDDQLVDLLGPAIFRTVILQGVNVAVSDFVLDPRVDRIVVAITVTLMVLIWGQVFLRGGNLFFGRLSENADRTNWIQPQTLPLVRFVLKVLLFAVMSYLIMSAWRINLTSWLASAGVVGIAVGFAAKDTLANFFSGVFILADAPYRVGQYIIIDGDTRGVVTEIGMRSTRLLTRDNVEVTVPNAVIGNAKIVNESSGPSQHMRVRVDVSVAYGSDVDRVREVLGACTVGLENGADDQPGVVRFSAMGASGLDFQVLVWVKHPVYRGRLIDELNTRVYKALAAAGIEIPFPQRDLHIRSWPAGEQGLSRPDA